MTWYQRMGWYKGELVVYAGCAALVFLAGAAAVGCMLLLEGR